MTGELWADFWGAFNLILSLVEADAIEPLAAAGADAPTG